MTALRWVSCASDAGWTTSRNLHLISSRRGSLTTLCGATGMPSTVWRGNKTKPQCPTRLEVVATHPGITSVITERSTS